MYILWSHTPVGEQYIRQVFMAGKSLAAQGASERRKRDQAIISAQGGTTRSSKTHKQNRLSGDTMTAKHQADQSEARFKRAMKAKAAKLKKKRLGRTDPGAGPGTGVYQIAKAHSDAVKKQSKGRKK